MVAVRPWISLAFCISSSRASLTLPWSCSTTARCVRSRVTCSTTASVTFGSVPAFTSSSEAEKRAADAGIERLARAAAGKRIGDLDEAQLPLAGVASALSSSTSSST